MSTAIIDEIFTSFARLGHRDYGERISLQEHMLQCACLAEAEAAGPLQVAAALLHDIGHLLHGLPEDIAAAGVDGHHEDIGADFLDRHFVAAVAQPTRLHVAAKRYLCATDPAYFATLSPASVESLHVQGGPFDPSEVKAFEQDPHWRAAVALRRWDDRGKIQGLATPPLEHFRPVLESGLAATP
ncbi:MAG: HD domain-containing protein [Candidatus Latescibacteria bacterium]|nr:HD domain-containing protein [Candidatus Latescibacterota bacterium]